MAKLKESRQNHRDEVRFVSKEYVYREIGQLRPADSSLDSPRGKQTTDKQNVFQENKQCKCIFFSSQDWN